MSDAALQLEFNYAINSAEPPPELVAQKDAAFLGLYRFQLHADLFHSGGLELLREHSRRCKTAPPRVLLPHELNRIKQSLKNNDASTRNFPLTGVIAPDSFRREMNGQSPPLLDPTAGTSKQRLLSTDQGATIPIEVSRKLGIVLFDGNGRFRVLLEEMGKTSSVKEIWVRISSAVIFTADHRHAFFDLLHGPNLRQLYLSNPELPSLSHQIASIDDKRKGVAEAQLIGKIPEGYDGAFFRYFSSKERASIARRAMSHPLVDHFVREEPAVRIKALFQGFGAASPIILEGLTDTVATIRLLDPTMLIFTLNFFFYFSIFMRKNKLENPLASHLRGEELEAQLQTNCRRLADWIKTRLNQHVRTGGDGQLTRFRDYFGKALPPGLKEVTNEVVDEVLASFDRLVASLEDVSLPKVPPFTLESRLIGYSDLTMLSPDSKGTDFTRFVCILESHFLSPLAEIFSAYVQLIRDDPSLALPKLYSQTFTDPEPYWMELCGEGDGAALIGAAARGKQNLQPWPEDEKYENRYSKFLSFLYSNNLTILFDVLASKGRVAALSPAQRQLLFNSVLASEWQATPQGQLIRQHLHLALFRVDSNRRLVPVTAPLGFDRCNAWLRKNLGEILSTLSDYSPFKDVVNLIEEDDDRFPVDDDNHDDLDDLLTDIVKLNRQGKKHRELANAVVEAVSELESLTIEPIMDLEVTTPGSSGSAEGEKDQREVSQENEDGGEESEGGKSRGTKRKKDGDEAASESEGEGDREGNGDGKEGKGQNENNSEEEEADEEDAEPELPKPKKKKKKANLDAAYRPPTKPSKPRPRSPSPSPAAIEPSSSLVLDDDNIFSDNSTADKRTTNLAAWKSSKLSSDPRKAADNFEKIVHSSSRFSFELIKLFRRSNQYRPFGTSIDTAEFEMDQFAAELKRFIENKAEGGEDGEEEDKDVEILSEVSVGPLWARVQCRVTELVIEILERGPEDVVYRYWSNFAA